MSRPLTIDELKALQVGDWVWIIDEDFKDGRYREITIQNEAEPTLLYVASWSNPAKVYSYSDYGTKWLAYKNKEQAETKGEWVELPCKASCVAVEAYEVESECSFCDFEIEGDHCPYCKFQDKRKKYHGKPICKYELTSRFIPIDKLSGMECLDKAKAQQECDKLNYDHACAVRVYCGRSLYLDDMGDLVKSITEEQAEARLKELRGEK